MANRRQRSTGDRPAISAHRGGAEVHRLQTWEAYRDAITAGADYVEFDVRRLADGTLVCYHDARAAAGPPLRVLSFAELCQQVGYEVPTVAELLPEIAGRCAGHIDLKEIGYEAEVVGPAVEILGEGSFVVTSLEDQSVATIARTFPRVRTALSLGRGQRDISVWSAPATRFGELFPLRRIRACGADWVAVDKTLARCGVLRQCARYGIGAMVWTVDGDSLIDRFLLDPRVNVLITNRPRHALARRAELLAEPG